MEVDAKTVLLIRRLALAVAATAPAAALAGPLAVVVSASSPAPKLSTEQVVAIFMGTVKSFPNGEKAIPVDQSAGSPPYSQFYNQVAGCSDAQVKAYWSRMVFTGKGSPRRTAAMRRRSRS